jgi:DNA-binding MarR family transcriptional regulator
MSSRNASPTSDASARQPSALDQASAEARIGVAWRELRRGASMAAMRERLYGDLLDPAQVDTLDLIMQREGLRMSELADALRVDASTATRAVNRLVDAGFVARVAAPGDGRGVVVVPSAEGRALYPDLSARRRTMLLEVLQDFSADDRAQLADLLERLVSGVDRYVTSTPGDDRSR